jgi:membrane fusion protein, heavy metal efflux system
MMKYTNTYCIAMALMATACITTPPEDNHSDSPNEASHAHEHLHLDSEQLQAFEVEYCSVQMHVINDSIQVRGTAEAPPQSLYDIGLPFGGEVQRMHYYEGAHVEKGSVLATVKHLSYIVLQEEFVQLLAKKQETDAAMKRQEALLADKNTSEKIYQEVRSAYRLNMAQLDGVTARLRLAGIDPEEVIQKGIVEEIALRAPVSGYITEAMAHIGMYVAPNSPVYRMVDPSHMHIELDVYQDQISRVSKGQKVKFSFGNARETHEGKIFLISQHTEKERKSINVHVHPSAKHVDGLRPGMFVQAVIITGSDSLRSLPPGAAVELNGKWMGIAGEGEHWQVVEFDPQDILADGWVRMHEDDQRQFVCEKLLRALSSVVESEGGGHGHSH